MICCLDAITPPPPPTPPPQMVNNPCNVRHLQPDLLSHRRCCSAQSTLEVSASCQTLGLILSFSEAMHYSIRVQRSWLCVSELRQQSKAEAISPSHIAAQHGMKSSTVLLTTVHFIKPPRVYMASLHSFSLDTRSAHMFHAQQRHQIDNDMLQICLPNHHCSCTCCRWGVRPTPLSKPATPIWHKQPPRAPTGSSPAIHSTADAFGSGQDVGYCPAGSVY